MWRKRKIKYYVKEYIREWWPILILASVCIGMAIFLTCTMMWSVKMDRERTEHFNSLTPEQQQVYIEQEEARKEANIHRYEIVSVFRYVDVKTNQFGGVIDTDICYAFEYLDNSGALHSESGFKHLEGGLTKVIIGDENLYIIDENGVDNHYYLQLTKETIAKIENKQ